jgi:hypothetical protein
MVPEYVKGLPFHALIVHATVVLLPLTALALVLAAFSSSIRVRMGIVLPLAGVVSLVLVPITINSGQQYRATLGGRGLRNPTLNRHADLAGQVLPWTIGLALMTIVVYALVVIGRRLAPRAAGAAATVTQPGRTRGAALAGRSAVSITVAVLSVAVAVGLVATVVAVGHLGATTVYGTGTGTG